MVDGEDRSFRPERRKKWEALGAVLATSPEGVLLPRDFGNPRQEYEALTTATVIADRSDRDWLRVEGEDRLRFIDSKMTCEVRSLVAGMGTYGFFTEVKGHVLSEALVLAEEELLFIGLSPGTGEDIVEHLSRYVITDRVEMTLLKDLCRITLAGPQAADTMTGILPLSELSQQGWMHSSVDIEGSPLRLVHEMRLGVEAFSLLFAATRFTEILEFFLQREVPPPPRLCGWQALDWLRLEEGIPLWGVDFDQRHLPQESSVEEAVSYTKGCYLGQEVVARLHYRGQCQRLARGLIFDREADPEKGAALLDADREVGRVTSCGYSPRLDKAIGLAVLQRKAADAGRRLRLESGGEAVVSDWPLVG